MSKKMTPSAAMKDAKKRGLVFPKSDSLTDDDFNQKYARIRITTMIDLVLKEKLEEEANKLGTKYQTLLNDIIFQYFENKKNSNIASRLQKLEKEFLKLKKKIA